jgi:hypothetical protein
MARKDPEAFGEAALALVFIAGNTHTQAFSHRRASVLASTSFRLTLQLPDMYWRRQIGDPASSILIPATSLKTLRPANNRLERTRVPRAAQPER